MIFRIIPACKSAFSEKMDNGTVHCTYFQQPIYQLPTIQSEKGKTFAFYKEPGQVAPSNLFSKWSSLQSNGIFYNYEGVQPIGLSYSSCQGYPNGHVLRLKTPEDMNIFWTVIPFFFLGSGTGEGDAFPIDLISGSNKQIVWRDGTPMNETVASGFTKYYINATLPDFYITTGNKQQLDINTGSSGCVYVICQVQPFQ